MHPRVITAVLALSLGVICLLVSCRRSEASGAPDAGETPRTDPKVACATLASKVRDAYGAVRNHYDRERERERWEKLVGRFDGARAETLRAIGESLHSASRAGNDIIMGGAEPWNQAGRSSDAERRERSRMIEGLVMEARKNAMEGLKQTDAKVAAFVAELEKSSDPSCARADAQ